MSHCRLQHAGEGWANPADISPARRRSGQRTSMRTSGQHGKGVAPGGCHVASKEIKSSDGGRDVRFEEHMLSEDFEARGKDSDTRIVLD